VKHPPPEVLIAVEEDVLPEGAAVQIRLHLEGCAYCRRLRDDLRASGALEPSLADLARLRKRVTGTKPPARLARWAAVGAVAAAAAVALLVRQPAAPPPQIARQPIPPPTEYRLTVEPAPLRLPLEVAVVLRGSPPSAEPPYLRDLGAALAPYRKGQYSEAVGQLRRLSERYPRAVEPVFYFGVSKLLSGDAGGAVPPLEAARAIGGGALNDDIRWYLAAAYERTGAWPKAAVLLGELCREEGAYQQRACQGARPK